MVDAVEAIGKARAAVSERAELPGMSLMEHLDELRKRIVRSAIFLFFGFIIAYVFHERLYGLVQEPLDRLHIKLNYTHPMDALRTAVSVWGAWRRPHWPPTVDQARELTAFAPSALAAFHRIRNGLDPVKPNQKLSLAGGFLQQLTGKDPDPAFVFIEKRGGYCDGWPFRIG